MPHPRESTNDGTTQYPLYLLLVHDNKLSPFTKYEDLHKGAGKKWIGFYHLKIAEPVSWYLSAT